MRIRVGGRASGKTTEMLRIAMETPDAVWVACPSHSTEHIKRMVEKDYPGRQLIVITGSEFLRGNVMHGAKANFYIDNAEYLFRENTGPNEIVMITMSAEIETRAVPPDIEAAGYGGPKFG